MKRILTLILLLSLSLMYGCFEAPSVVVIEVVLISPEGTINAPLLNGQPFGYNTPQPGNALLVSFASYVDQYGASTGLSDDEKYTVKNATFRMPSKCENDTVFWTVDLPRNQFRVVPGWTGTINPYNGFEWAPFIGWEPYKFDCKMEYGSQLPYGMPEGDAEMFVEAEANKIDVEFAADPTFGTRYPGGYYKLDVSYSDKINTHRFVAEIEEPGVYDVNYYDVGGKLVGSWRYTVPATWFTIDELFYVHVGGNGQCALSGEK